MDACKFLGTTDHTSDKVGTGESRPLRVDSGDERAVDACRLLRTTDHTSYEGGWVTLGP